MGLVLSINGLTKKYGKITAVDHLDLEVSQGSVFGILGPNGSGKTTTLAMLLGVVKPREGSYEWFGNPASYQSRQKIGAILETPNFYPYLSAVKNLEIVAKIKNCENRSDEVLEQVGLYERRKDPFRTYSLGMKQRLAIAAAMMANPPVLVLDEPTNGLDPQGIAEIRELIKEISQMNKTIIMASHLLDEVQKVCTDFAVLSRGKKLYHGNVKEALATNELELASDNMELLEKTLVDEIKVQVLRRENGCFIMEANDESLAGEINAKLHLHGVCLSHLSARKNSLEKQFLAILNENQQK